MFFTFLLLFLFDTYLDLNLTVSVPRYAPFKSLVSTRGGSFCVYWDYVMDVPWRSFARVWVVYKVNTQHQSQIGAADAATVKKNVVGTHSRAFRNAPSAHVVMWRRDFPADPTPRPTQSTASGNKEAEERHHLEKEVVAMTKSTLWTGKRGLDEHAHLQNGL